MRATEDFKDASKLDEYRDIVEGLRSIPVVKPRLSLMLKVAWRSRVTGAPGVGEPSTASREKRTGLSQLPRAAVVAFLVICFALVLFFGLTLFARGSHPGDTLYVFKVAREKISMAFTGGPVARANKNLELARERLKELDYFVSKNKIDPDSIKYIAKQYNENKVQVQKVISQQGTAPGGSMLASQLENLETRKTSILGRMSAAASSDSILARAAGASVAVRDHSGSQSLVDGLSNIYGQADESGKYEFDYTLPDKNKAPEIDTTVELDGYKTTAPVFASGEQPIVKGQLEVVVEPRMKVLASGQSEQFTLRLNQKGGDKIGGRRMVLEDRSGASLVNGQSGKVELAVGGDGSYSFSVTKTSSLVSRISLSVFDGTLVEMGDVLVLGTSEKVAGGSTKSGVVARVAPSGGGNRIELDNGLVQVAADSERPYAIIESMNKSENNSINAGPLEDMLGVPDVPGKQGPIEIKGPSLVYSNSDSAAYEIDIGAKLSELTVHRVYEVNLAKGNGFVSIMCKTSVESSGLQPSRNYNPESVQGMRLPRGLDTRIGGVPAGSLSEDGQPASISFDSTRPYVTFKSGGRGIVLCYPTRGPDSWAVDSNYVYTSFREGTIMPGIASETTSFLGFSDEGDVPPMINKALETQVNVPDTRVGESLQDWGFEIECTPPLKDLKTGRQRLTLTIRKRYEKLSDYFGRNN